MGIADVPNRANTVPVTFRDAELEKDLELRGGARHSKGIIAKRDLTRYYLALARALPTVRLSPAEAALVVDATAGELWPPDAIPLLWAKVADALSDWPVPTSRGVDGSALVESLRGLSLVQVLALVDALERYHARREVVVEDPAATLRAVGLIR